VRLDVRLPLPLDLPAIEEAPRMPAGFRAGAVAAGIKESGRPNLGVLATIDGRPVPAAAMFTQHPFSAAPVILSRRHLAESGQRAAAVLSTSGSANAASGPAGELDQRELAAELGECVGVAPELTLAISTGLIGTRLPVERIREPLRGLVATGLAASDGSLAALAAQMMTTDTRAKWATTTIELPAADGSPKSVRVSGIAKGVGMIHPRMATMLAVLLTDAAAGPAALTDLLRPAVERTWNQLTVDGDTSTNDTVLLLASGASGTAPVVAGSPEQRLLAGAVMAVARSLARQQAADGEGATTLITCQVSGGRDDAQARAVARAIVGSSLLKAAVHGRDPNWGRIVMAAGNAEADGRPAQITAPLTAVAICGVAVFDGAPLPFDKPALTQLMDAPEVLIRLDLGRGDGIGEAFGCDLTEAYVVENSAYST
jgi:glutamate N-acetyltransferase / amino-acid N-acetyltransferase